MLICVFSTCNVSYVLLLSMSTVVPRACAYVLHFDLD